MTTVGKVIILSAVGAGVYLLVKRTSAPTAVAPKPPVSKTPWGFQAVAGLPGISQAYSVLNPIYNKVLEPVVTQLNKVIADPINQYAFGGAGQVTITKNPDGTINRQVSGVNTLDALEGVGTAAVNLVKFW